MVGKLHCKGSDETSCDEEFGSVVKLFGAFLPTIAAKAICIEDPSDNSRTPSQKKWETIVRTKFLIKSLTDRDLVCVGVISCLQPVAKIHSSKRCIF